MSVMHSLPALTLLALGLIFLQNVDGSIWNSWRPMYPGSGKRQQLPYHPVARFRGADSRPYFGYNSRVFTDYPQDKMMMNDYEEDPYPTQLSAGELLSRLFSGLKDQEMARVRGPLRFGISRR